MILRCSARWTRRWPRFSSRCASRRGGATRISTPAPLGGAMVAVAPEPRRSSRLGAALDPLHPGLVSNHAFRLISNVRALGAALLRRRLNGVWGGVAGRHVGARPVEPVDFCARRLRMRARHARGGARDGAEATASLQQARLATPAAGWHNAGAMPRRRRRPRAAAASCSALNEVVRGRAASRRAARPSRRSPRGSPSARGSTNERLVVHVGLSVPRPGSARLRLGEPSAVAAARAGGGGGAAEWSHEEAGPRGARSPLTLLRARGPLARRRGSRCRRRTGAAR